MFSLNHSCVGRSTHGSGTAGAHMEYVTRESACTVVMGQNMPVPRPGRVRRTRAWIDRQEQAIARTPASSTRSCSPCPATSTPSGGSN